MNKLFKIVNKNGTHYLSCAVENAGIFESLLRENTGDFNEIKVFEAGKMPLSELPEDIQEKAKDILKAYDEVNVIYENQEFHVSTGIAILARYPQDKFTCGYYKQEEVYTKEERKQNFKEVFGYLPYNM